MWNPGVRKGNCSEYPDLQGLDGCSVARLRLDHELWVRSCSLHMKTNREGRRCDENLITAV